MLNSLAGIKSAAGRELTLSGWRKVIRVSILAWGVSRVLLH